MTAGDGREGVTALPDGRELGWGEYGDPAGKPVLFLCGAPGSRLPIAPGQGEAARTLGVRLICAERPGFGLSTRHPERTLVGWADDVAALADALGLDRFAVIGYSAGGPHALACAARLGGRLTRAVAAGCGAPWDVAELARDMDWPRRTLRFLALHAPWLLRLTYRSLPDARRHPERLVRKMLAGLPPPDQELLARDDVFRLAVEHTVAAVPGGLQGMADEVLLLARPWGFELESIAVPVTLWSASEDTAAPVRQAEYLAQRIPGAQLRRVEGSGHLFIIERWPEVLASAVADGPHDATLEP